MRLEVDVSVPPALCRLRLFRVFQPCTATITVIIIIIIIVRLRLALPYAPALCRFVLCAGACFFLFPTLLRIMFIKSSKRYVTMIIRGRRVTLTCTLLPRT